jgi:hypothetical protein
MAIENPKKHMDLGFKTFLNSSIIFGYLFKPRIENLSILNIKIWSNYGYWKSQKTHGLSLK